MPSFPKKLQRVLTPTPHRYTRKALSARKFTILILVLIFTTTTIVSFFCSKFIRDFLKEDRVETVARLVQTQALQHLAIDDTVKWQQAGFQEELRAFKEEIEDSYQYIVALKLHSPEGMLIWTDMPNEPLGTFSEKLSVLKALEKGSATNVPSNTIKKELGVTDLEEIYIPIKNNLGVTVAVSEIYINLSDVPYATSNITFMLWAAMVIVTMIITALLHFALQRRDKEIASQSKNLAALVQSLEEEVYNQTQELIQEKNKMENVLASLGEGMIATDTQGIITTINHAATQLIGMHAHETLGKEILKVIPMTDEQGVVLPDSKRVCLEAMTSERMVTQNNVYIVRNDGLKVPVKIVASPIVAGSKITGAVLILNDVTKEKEAEEVRKNFISIASHQLRTPLSGAQWLLETLKKKTFGNLTPKQEEYIDEIYKTNERMGFLVHDILNLLRAEGNTITLKKELVSVQSVFNVIFQTLRAAAERKGISLKFPHNTTHTITTDATLLQTILETLISNAINYSHNNTSILISFKEDSSGCTFSIQDFGIGIPHDSYPKLFERFYRAPNAKDFDEKGTGLGLYVAYLLAQKIRATISFESELGKGTTFFVHILSK